MHLPPGLPAGFSKCFEEILAVHVIQENVVAPIATTHHVVNRSRILDA
jgi:hypothetical protein